MAVKTLKASATQKEREDLLKELNVMKMFYDDPHPNVVRLLGCCTTGSDKGAPCSCHIEIITSIFQSKFS